MLIIIGMITDSVLRADEESDYSHQSHRIHHIEINAIGHGGPGNDAFRPDLNIPQCWVKGKVVP